MRRVKQQMKMRTGEDRGGKMWGKKVKGGNEEAEKHKIIKLAA